MKRKASASHDEAVVRRLRKDPEFAAEYLKAALEDEDEPRVLLIALRHLAKRKAWQESPRLPALSARAFIEHSRRTATLACPRWSQLPERLVLNSRLKPPDGWAA